MSLRGKSLNAVVSLRQGRVGLSHGKQVDRAHNRPAIERLRGLGNSASRTSAGEGFAPPMEHLNGGEDQMSVSSDRAPGSPCRLDEMIRPETGRQIY
ncbi:MAG: hypothetical protein WBE76_01435 [Terracidiphilus sp.]